MQKVLSGRILWVAARDETLIIIYVGRALNSKDCPTNIRRESHCNTGARVLAGIRRSNGFFIKRRDLNMMRAIIVVAIIQVVAAFIPGKVTTTHISDSSSALLMQCIVGAIF